MSRRWVLNASPLIVLSRISQLSLIQEICEELVIPAGVAEEIERGPGDDPLITWMREKGSRWIREPGPPEPLVASWDLGLGESQVITWSFRNKDFEAVLDDQAARRCALSLGIRVRGTIGILLLAKKEGKLKQIKPDLEQLIKAGFRINSELMRTALKLAGEE